MNTDIPYISGVWPHLLTAFGAIAIGLVCILRPDWVHKNKELPPERAERNRNICKKCGNLFILIGIVLVLLDLVAQ